MRPPWPALRGVSSWDLVLSLVLTVLSQAELLSLGRSAPLTVVLSLAITLPLLVRRQAPVLVALVVMAAFGGQVLVLDQAPSVLGHGLSLVVVFFTAGAERGAPRTWPLLLVGLLVALVFERNQGDVDAAAGDMVIYGAAWAVGLLLGRRRREDEARLNAAEDEVLRAQERLESALAAERQRVARELHDVVSHAITVVVLQARGAETVLDTDPERVREALGAIEASGQEALGEMRRLVTFLREAPDSAPQPDLGDIPTLVESARREVAVDLEITHGLAGLGHGAGLTAYRLVQECLTNALRHAPGAPVAVRIDQSPGAMVIEVSNPVVAGARSCTPGFGLVGMRERTELYGGALEFGEGDGRWTVRCRLPVLTPAVQPAEQALVQPVVQAVVQPVGEAT